MREARSFEARGGLLSRLPEPLVVRPHDRGHACQLVGAFISGIEHPEVGFCMQDGRLDQQSDQRIAPMMRAQSSKRSKFRHVCLSLHSGDVLESPGSELGRGEDLQEQLVTVAALPDERARKPGVEFSLAPCRQTVVDPVGAITLGDSSPGNEPIADESFEDLVEVPDVELTPLGPDRLLEGRFQLVPVTRTPCQHREHRVLDRHRPLPVPAASTL
jgi:hypothetical protein